MLGERAKVIAISQKALEQRIFCKLPARLRRLISKGLTKFSPKFNEIISKRIDARVSVKVCKFLANSLLPKKYRQHIHNIISTKGERDGF
jgi:hypothetical protein